ncbi:BAG family molecular chaperone regulator 6 [Chenopodium quinoa]|uniref:BAG domain-containing protein n=1 Tax=Chenopodium quinoa TaxID=63459 RepID=A0A803M339_CHEQI|nr:BAG family molecular chaperone regulator 6 [Chenopodium quinoa]
MYPVYRGMNSYPYQTNQMPSTQYYNPSWEGVPQMKEDQPSSSCMPESLPPNYGYPAPMQCHSCCSHGQHPTYYNFRPPCSHFPPPPPPTYNHFCGGYPPYPQFHSMYYAPPPHYSMELPKYEYDKSVLRDQHHCCECSNHPCHMKGRNSVKIEEHEPDVETKKTESLLPAGAKNFQYPIMWIPPEYMMNKEQPRRLVENEASGQQVLPYSKKPQVQWGPTETEAQDNEGSLSRKPHQNTRSAEPDPNVRNGWFPLDLNNIKQLMDGGDTMHSHGQENRSRNEIEGSASGRKPHQNVQSIEQNPNTRNGWIPLVLNRNKQLMNGGDVMKSCDQESRNLGGKNARDVENKDLSKQYPVIWIPNNGQIEDYLKGWEDRSAGKTTAEESPAFNDVPRKLEHIDNEAEKGRTKAGDDGSRVGTQGTEKKSNVRIIPVKQLDESVDKLSKKDDDHKVDGAPVSKASQDSAKNCTSRQSTKKSKLPPICLRVDPPKKKNGNGSSRSPSPPGDKKRQNFEESSSEKDNKQPNKEIKVKDVEEKVLGQNKSTPYGAGDTKEGSQNLKDEVTSAENMVMQQADIDKPEDKKGSVDKVQSKGPQVAIAGGSKQESNQKRKVMSDMEAAVVIQSAYRGYNVRRWEPIKKLKHIAKVHEEAIRVKNLIKDLESRSAIEDKEKVAIGETIMNLLLKLDSIQGLHESVRDVRKSVAKELISLQEKLDNITSQKCPGFEKVNESVGKSSEGSSLHRDNGASEREGINSNDLSSSQSPLCQDVLGGSQSYSNTKEESVVELESHIGPQDENVMSPARRNGDVVAAGLVSEIIEEPNASDTVQGQSPIESEESLVNARPVMDTVMEDDMVHGNKDQEANLLSELPQEVVEEESLVTMSPVKETTVQNDLVSGIKDQEEHQPLLPQEVNEEFLSNDNIAEDTAGQSDIAGNREYEADFLSELPVEVVEEDDKMEISLTEHDLGASKLSSPDDGKELTEAKTSGNSNSDQEVDQPGKGLEAGNEGIVANEHENHEALEMSSEETINGQETGSNVVPANIEIPVMEEVDSKLPEAGEGEVFAVAPGVPVEGGVEFPPHKENEDQFRVESLESNVECSSSTTSLIDPFDYNEYTSEFLSGDQGNESETVKPELPESDVQQSKEKEGTMGESLDDQSSVVGGTKDEQIDKKIVEENVKLREMLEKLLAAGKEQQEVISSLNGKVKDLQKKLAKKKSVKSAKHPKVSRSSCGKPANGSPRERSLGIAS